MGGWKKNYADLTHFLFTTHRDSLQQQLAYMPYMVVDAQPESPSPLFLCIQAWVSNKNVFVSAAQNSGAILGPGV